MAGFSLSLGVAVDTGEQMDPDGTGKIHLSVLKRYFDPTQDELVLKKKISAEDAMQEFCQQWDMKGEGMSGECECVRKTELI